MAILSPKEIDALIESSKIDKFPKDSIDEYQPQKPKTVSILDSEDYHKSPDYQPTEELNFENKYPLFELLLSKFINFFKSTTKEFFQVETKIEYQTVNHSKFKEISNKDNFIVVYHLEPFNSFMAIHFEIVWLEKLLLQNLNNQTKLTKNWYKQELTKFFLQIEIGLNKSWEYLYPVNCIFKASFLNADFLKKNQNKDYGVHFNFLVTTTQLESSFLVSFHDRINNSLSNKKLLTKEGSLHRKKELLVKKLVTKKVKIGAVLGHYQISMDDLLTLEEEDVIMTDYKKGSPILITVSDQQKFVGQFFPYKDRKAVRLLKKL